MTDLNRLRSSTGVYGVVVGTVAFLALCATQPGRAAGARLERHTTRDVCQGCRTHPAEQMRDMPSARSNGADVADHLRGGPPMGSSDQSQSGRPTDAALVHRQDHRHFKRSPTTDR